MATDRNPHDPKASRKRTRPTDSSPGAGGFRAPHPDRAADKGQHDRWTWLERFDRDLADALEDSQYDVDGQYEVDRAMPDWPGRYADDDREE